MAKRSDTSDAGVRRRARAAGVVSRYTDGLGVARAAPLAAVEALMDVLQPAEATADVVATRVGHAAITWSGFRGASRGWRGAVALESGGSLDVTDLAGGRLTLSGKLPLGVHRLVMKQGRRERSAYVLAGPAKLDPASQLRGRRLACFLPLYALGSRAPSGMGTYSELGELVEWAGRSANAFTGTLPLFPAFLDERFDPSPYAPVSRLFWNELFIDLRRAPEWRSPAVKRSVGTERAQAEIRACARGEWVDYRRSWKIMRALLETMSAAARRHDDRWARVRATAGAESGEYARFRAAVEAGSEPTSGDRRIRGRDVDPHAVDIYIYAQALANEQMAAIAGAGGGSSPLYLDLPVGVHPGGYDVWRRPDLFMRGAVAGAPPDGLHASGQVWGFPPMHPTAGRADGYAHLRAVLRRLFQVAGVLRIDHVMWLERMYCVMPGFGGEEGAYVQYPAEELMAVVLIEAARAHAVVVGEDLGTVTDTTRRRMRRRGILGMHVQQFAMRDPSDTNDGSGAPSAVLLPPRTSLASLNTHDTPTFAGYWTGADIDLRLRLGHIDRPAARSERAGRGRVRAAVRSDLSARGLPAMGARGVGVALMRLQARSDAPITLVNLEDLWGETRPQNVPGTLDEYPNWRRRAGRTPASIIGDPSVNRVIRSLAHERAAEESLVARRRS